MKSITATQDLFHEMFDNVQTGRWAAGSAIPSERTLIEQYGVSRIAIREALSMLRGMGVLDVQHGRRTKIRELDSEIFGRLLPLLLTSGTQQTFEQVFDVRLALESRTTYLAASLRTQQELERIEDLAKRYRQLVKTKDDEAGKVDLEFHLEIARVTRNPLYAILLEALSDFIFFAQNESCKGDPLRQRRAVAAHAKIAKAIAARDADGARAAMENHLRYSLTRRIS